MNGEPVEAVLTVMPLNFNGLGLLKTCLPSWVEAVSACSHPVDLWLVDNASSDGSEAWMREHHPEIRWVGLEKNAILQSYNEVLKVCTSPYVMILNNDVQLEALSLDPLLERMRSDERAFGVMPKIEADLEHERVLSRLGGRFFRGHLAHVGIDGDAGGTLYLHGAAMVVNRERFLALGGFDPMFFYFEDNDLSYRAWRAGYHCWFEPKSSVHHLGSQTTSQVYRGVVDRRALKEKASALFVLKNIQNKLWLLNFVWWTLLKTVMGLLRWDRQRFWALGEVKGLLLSCLKARAEQSRLSDLDLLQRVRELKS